jgi:hypothetical protein
MGITIGGDHFLSAITHYWAEQRFVRSSWIAAPPNHPQVASIPSRPSIGQSVTNREKIQAVANALIRDDNRDSLRAIVLA